MKKLKDRERIMPIMGVWIDKIRSFIFDTVEEMRNAMEVLADTLAHVILE